MDRQFSLVGYKFRNLDILELAFTHRSYSKDNFERLEFLGDSILDLVIGDILYKKFPHLPEGKLTQFRSSLTNRECLNEIGESIGIKDFIKLGKGENLEENSILGNVVEALIAAIYLESSFNKAYEIVEKIYQSRLNKLHGVDDLKDAKSKLQEYLQQKNLPLPNYILLKEESIKDKKLFTVKCSVASLKLEACSTKKSLKKAEKSAASMILENLKA
tara:strand:- start:31475 stop:32125 length:651 start_codon:yes stop_codon:yes gene_type:complete